MSNTFFELESKLQKEFWAASNVFCCFLFWNPKLFFSSALHFSFVLVKGNEFLHILKKAWTLLKMDAR